MALRQNVSKEFYLLKLLAALVKERGGEVRIKDDALSALKQGNSLPIFYDPATQETIIRYSSEPAEVFVLGSEAAAWIVPTAPPTQQGQPTQRPVNQIRPSVLSDEQLVQMEQQRAVNLKVKEFLEQAPTK